MKNVLLQVANKLNKNRRQRKWWQRAVRVMGAVVVFCTTYALILPAITMEQTPVCGMEAHEHGQSCYVQQAVYTYGCGLDGETDAAHTHTDTCYEQTRTLVCQNVHTHSEACAATETLLICAEEEGEAHTHGEGCYETRDIPCELTTNDGHVHEESCYQVQQELVCGLSETVAHSHTESCLIEGEPEQVLICQIPVHVHEDACYPLEEDGEAQAEYLCGSGVHAHVEGCYNAEGVLTCTIPAHVHEAACMVKDLDLNADVETVAQWKQSVEDVILTGIWRDDLLAVAETQLDYAESSRNVVLEGETLKGYTRYGARFNDLYGDWDAMFVSFCLEYAEITADYIPYETDSAAWARKLTAQGLYAEADDYTPVAGDLVFVDTDQDGEADRVGIFSDMLEGGKLRMIAGDTAKGCVAYETIEEGVAGYGILPQNPLTQEQWNAANELASRIAALPAVEDVQAGFQSLNEEGDKAGYEALRQELVARLDAIIAEYDSFNELQKKRAGSLDGLNALMELCGGATWQQFPALTDDGAVVTGLSGSGAEVIPASNETAQDESVPENAVRNGDRVEYRFTVDMDSYYTDIQYGEARVKVELVLPLTKDKAVFDLSAMTWLEESKEALEVRSINDVDTICQVLTGYRRLAADDVDGIVAPGSFTETIPVKVLSMTHGEKVSVIISAAMEHGTWEGLCQTHQIAEKLQVQTEAFTIYNPLSAEEQDIIYRNYLSQIESIVAMDISQEEKEPLAQVLLEQVVNAYESGQLSAAELESLGNILRELLGMYAEYATGIGWMLNSGAAPVGATSYARYRSVTIEKTTAMSAAVYSSLFPSDVQIDEEGGYEASDDNAVLVGKTIQGTDVENVFDITLEIVTQDKVNTVIDEPDMAVVVVMDISNTMNSDFGTGSRYDAAMVAAEHFMENFAENTADGKGLSKIGYVAFNTNAHEIFPLSECSTDAEVASLVETMQSETAAIIKAPGYSTISASNTSRFTNMEAGLKMARDMLADATNKNKYIIFLSDGFPTTYLWDGYTGYIPYNVTTPYDTRSSYGTSYFYDSLLGKYCSLGTNYSDVGAIRAREMATAIKASGVNIFSIGVNVSGQSLQTYQTQSQNNSFSTIDRRGSTYEIHGATTTTPGADTDFKNWLRDSIGSGYYYDSVNVAQLETAYADIFQEIVRINAASSHLDWVATDPMPGMGVYELETIEFIGFWDVNGELQTDKLVGESKDGEEYENSATFNAATQTISWDLKNSRYVTQVMGDTTNYRMWMTYRVRLKNEKDAFVENQIYDTNDTTSLAYRIIEVVDGVTQISERRNVGFPIPAVHGYLSELNFKKVSPAGTGLSGAEFTLTHDTANCGYCRGDGISHVTLPVYEAVSDADGMVTFTRIPSGHQYILTETKVPDGYILTGNTYSVQIAYDVQTVTVLDADGNPLEWTSTIENETYYALPETGGMGTSHFTFGGLLIIAAALVYVITFGRKRKKGGM